MAPFYMRGIGYYYPSWFTTDGDLETDDQRVLSSSWGCCVSDMGLVLIIHRYRRITDIRKGHLSDPRRSF